MNLPRPQTPGPWGWFGHVGLDYHLATHHGGRVYVMGFRRMGMRAAQPTFQVYERPDDHLGDGCGRMTPASDLAILEKDYRRDIVGFDNPDARAIAALPDWIDRADRLEALLRRAREVVDAPARHLPGSDPHDCQTCAFVREIDDAIGVTGDSDGETVPHRGDGDQ